MGVRRSSGRHTTKRDDGGDDLLRRLGRRAWGIFSLGLVEGEEFDGQLEKELPDELPAALDE